MSAALDVVYRIAGSVVSVLNDTYRQMKVSLQRVHNKSLFKVKTENMIDESAPMEDNFSIVPTFSLPDDV